MRFSSTGSTPRCETVAAPAGRELQRLNHVLLLVQAQLVRQYLLFYYSADKTIEMVICSPPLVTC